MSGGMEESSERRRSEDYPRFMTALGDATRMLADPEEIMDVSARMIGEQMRE